MVNYVNNTTEVTEVTETRRKRNTTAKENETSTRLDPEKARARIFERAAKLLAAKSRSVAELRERLLQGRGANRTAVDEVIERLRECGYLDDAKFAQSYASNRVQQRPIGRQRLQRDLWLKKIDKNTADEALDKIYEAMPEEQLIDRAIEKRTRLSGKPKNRAEAKKLFDHLLRQGFAFDLVSERVRAIVRSESDE